MRATLIAALVAASCQAIPPYLDDYAQLERVEEDLWAWVGPAAAASDYDSLLVGPLAAVLKTTGVSARVNQHLALTLRDELIAESCAAGFEIATQKSAGAARVRCRITPFRGSSLLEQVPGLEGPPGAALETEVTDARTEELLATFVQVSWDPAFRNNAGDLDLRGRRIVAAWAEQLVAALVERGLGPGGPSDPDSGG